MTIQKTSIISLALLTLYSAPALGTPSVKSFSMFFSESELQDISHFRKTDLFPEKQKKVSLEGLFYCSPQNWTIWVNGTHITRTQSHPFLHVYSITPREVTLEWADEHQKHRVILRPNQSYDPGQGK